MLDPGSDHKPDQAAKDAKIFSDPSKVKKVLTAHP
jgi:hypothetical protein